MKILRIDTHPNLRRWRWMLAAGLAATTLSAHAGGTRWAVGVGSPGVAVQVQGGGGHGHAYRHGPAHGYSAWRGGGYGWRGPRWSVWGPAIGIGIGVPLIYGAERTTVYVAPEAAPAPAPPSRPDPVVYPRDGQSPRQAEADRRACDRWATTQPAAMADASVFHRSVEACMDGRGYTLR